MTKAATVPGQLDLIEAAGDARILELEAELDEVRALLDEAARLLLDPVPAPTRVRAIFAAAGVDPEAPATALERRDAGTARAAARWTEEEVDAVDNAIATIARRARWLELEPYLGLIEVDGETVQTFTTDNVWQELGAGFPVTKGIAGRLIAAANAGVIVNTGHTTVSRRAGIHGHAQRLTVWRPVVA